MAFAAAPRSSRHMILQATPSTFLQMDPQHRRVAALSSQLSRNLTGTAPHALAATSTVVVTGASGFVGSWLTKLLLERGHCVRACVRDLGNERKVAFLVTMQSAAEGRLTLHAADMTIEGAYDSIFQGAHTVFHPAEVSPSLQPWTRAFAAHIATDRGVSPPSHSPLIAVALPASRSS